MNLIDGTHSKSWITFLFSPLVASEKKMICLDLSRAHEITMNYNNIKNNYRRRMHEINSLCLYNIPTVFLPPTPLSPSPSFQSIHCDTLKFL